MPATSPANCTSRAGRRRTAVTHASGASGRSTTPPVRRSSTRVRAGSPPLALTPRDSGSTFCGESVASRASGGMTDDHKAKATPVPSSRFPVHGSDLGVGSWWLGVAWVTVQERMQDVSHTDRRYNQTQDRYAADDLETMQEARRYADHVFGLVRPFLGSRVLEVGSGIGTMSTRLVEIAEMVVGIEPNPNCLTRLQEAMGSHPRFTLRTCHFE